MLNVFFTGDYELKYNTCVRVERGHGNDFHTRSFKKQLQSPAIKLQKLSEVKTWRASMSLV